MSRRNSCMSSAASLSAPTPSVVVRRAPRLYRTPSIHIVRGRRCSAILASFSLAMKKSSRPSLQKFKSKLPGGSLKTLLCGVVSNQNNMCLLKKLVKPCHKPGLLGACSTTSISCFVCLHGAGVNADKAVEWPRATGMERRGTL